MERLDTFIQDDVEAKFLALENKKRKRKRRRRKIRLVCVLAILISVTLYFISDASKIKTLEVEGNIYYSDQQILDQANLSYDSRYILHPTFLINMKLKKLDLINKVKVNRSWDGNISIHVKEDKVIGYYITDNENRLLLGDGSSKSVSEQNLEKIVNFPLIDGFSDEQLKNLAKAFTKKGDEVQDSIIAMISEILPHEESYDKHAVKIVMQDGNTLYGSYDDISVLNYYLQTLKSLEGNHVCLFMMADEGTMPKMDCDSFE